MLKQETQKLNFNKDNDYKERYLDIPLPNVPLNPDRVYGDEWEGWPTFLKNYPPYEKLKQETKKLNFGSGTEYQKRYKDIPLPNVPSRPETVYGDEWEDWPTFLGKDTSQKTTSQPKTKQQSKTKLKKEKNHPPYQALKQEAQKLNFGSGIEYKKRYKEIPLPNVPSHPETVYGDEWEGWPTFLGTEKKPPPYQVLKQEAKKLNFGSGTEYQKRYKEIPLPNVPSNPDRVYGDEWKGWPTFLGTEKDPPPYQALKQETKKLNFGKAKEYKKRYKEIPLPNVPSHPETVYGDEWEDWPTFLGKEKDPPPYQVLKQEAQKLYFVSGTEYKKMHGEIPLPNVPKNPETVYGDEWEGWPIFLGTEKDHPPYQALKQETKKLNFGKAKEYEKRYTEIPLPNVPSRPDVVYGDEWEDWPTFLGTKKDPPPYQVLKQEAQKLNFGSGTEYKKRYKEIPLPNVPKNPETVYGDKWEGWPTFLGKEKDYPPYQALKQETQKFNFSGAREYFKRYGEIPLPNVPSRPDVVYGDEWEDWPAFLGTNNQSKTSAKTKLKDRPPYPKLKQETQKFNFGGAREYFKRYGEIPLPNVPSHPETVYGREWEGWPAFLGTNRLTKTTSQPKTQSQPKTKQQPKTSPKLKDRPPYLRLKQEAQKLYFGGAREYFKRYGEIPLPNVPSHPETVYGREWEGWPAFLGKNLQNKQPSPPHKELNPNKECAKQLSLLKP